MNVFHRCWLVLAVTLAMLAGSFLVTIPAVGAETGAKRVLFTYRAPQAKTVSLAGEFIGDQLLPMTRREDGTWTCWVSVPPGRHGYRFRVDDADWKNDPANSVRKTVADEVYSAITVGPPPAEDIATREPPAAGPSVTPTPRTHAPSKPKPGVTTPGSPVQAANIDITVLKKRNTRSNSRFYDDRQQTVQVQVTITNKELAKEFTNLSGELYVVARSVSDNRAYQLILREANTFDLPLRGKVDFESGLARLNFYESRWMREGYKYYGYVYLVKNEQEKLLALRAVPESLYKSLESFKDKPLNTLFDL